MADNRRSMAGDEPVILVIDDEAAIAEIIAEVLREVGYRVEVARDSGKALERALTKPPALILLDLRMPGVTGRQFLREYRAARGTDTPIVVVTAVAEAQRDGIGQWTDAVLTKPFDLDELLELVGRWVPRPLNAGS